MSIFKKESAEEKTERLMKEQQERQEKWQKEYEELMEKEKIEKKEKEKLENDIEYYRNNSKRIFNFTTYDIVLTNDDKIVFIYDEKKQHRDSIKRIDRIVDIKDILKVDIVAETRTKQVHNWMNILVFTMEQKQEIQSLELKIITLDEIIRYRINKSNVPNFFDQLEILEAYLQRKIINNQF